MNLTAQMRRDWDDRARRNVFHYIASWRQDWTETSFIDSGEQDFESLVAPVLARCGIPVGGKVMVELGCGAGRMTRNFASRYRSVIAVDLSAEMLGRARRLHGRVSNILWLQIAGSNLACLSSACVDLAFSYLVLHHLPSEDLALGYIAEMLRVLRPGGAFLFQFSGAHVPAMNLRGRIAWRIVDTLWAAGCGQSSRKLANLVGLDPAVAGKSWRGAILDPNTVLDKIRSCGGEVRELRGGNSAFTWCCGVKQTSRS